MGTQPDVLASGLGPDAEALLYVGDRCGEVGSGIDQVVNQHVILNSIQAAQAELLPRNEGRAAHRPPTEGNHGAMRGIRQSGIAIGGQVPYVSGVSMTQAPLSGPAAAAVGLAAFGVVVTEAGWQVVRHGAVMAHEGAHAMADSLLGRQSS